jgi:class 3 adenylate cyclase
LLNLARIERDLSHGTSPNTILIQIPEIFQTEPYAAEPAREPARPAEAERRQLTVMFCDLVGSTPLSARLDPEDLRDVIAIYQRCVEETVRRFDGFIAKFMGAAQSVKTCAADHILRLRGPVVWI